MASNSEEIKPIAIVIIELQSSNGISKQVSQSVNRKILLPQKILKFHIILVERVYG